MRALRLVAIAAVFAFVVACSKAPAPVEPTPTPAPTPKVAKAERGDGSGEGSGKGGGGGEKGRRDKRGGGKGDGRMAEKMERSRYALEIVKPDGTSVKIPAKELWEMRESEPMVIGGKSWHGPTLAKVIEKAGIEKYKKIEFHKKDTGFAVLKKDIDADPNRYRLIFSRVPDLKLADAKVNHPGVRRATHLKKIYVSAK
ncbi:MAG: hypothetical protein KJ042_07535 [Deltaproteobacteria bacterium]|nr:hypothetical protein [Deltaproteobacteria bacterium]